VSSVGGSGFRAQGSGLRVLGFEFRVQDLRSRFRQVKRLEVNGFGTLWSRGAGPDVLVGVLGLRSSLIGLVV